MGIARGLERRLERLVDGFASRLFSGRVHPVELGTQLVREADLALFETLGGPGAPNHFDVVLGGEAADPEILDNVAGELAAFVEETARDRGWRLEGPVQVQIAIDGHHKPRAVQVTTTVAPGVRPAWAVLRPIAEAMPRIAVTVNRSIVGRASKSDVQVLTDDVSRVHAVLWEEAGSKWVADLVSSNGTAVNGSRIDAPTAISEGDLVTFGHTQFVLSAP